MVLTVMVMAMLAFSSVTIALAGSGGGVRGLVRSDGKPIGGATVRLLDLDRSTSTNESGEFVFSNVPEGSHTLFVRMIGYGSVSVSVQVNDQIAESQVDLRESAVQEEEIVVSASPYARTANEQYQPSESKSALDLQESPGTSFAEKISDLPGVSVRSMI